MSRQRRTLVGRLPFELLPCTHANGKGVLDIPARLNSTEKSCSTDTSLTRPLRKRIVLPLKFNEAAWSFVGCLLTGRGPTAVPGGVRPVIINSVDGMSRRWSRTHISIEHDERSGPCFAHHYPSTAIVGIVLIFRVRTSLLHLQPRGVLRTRAKTVFYGASMQCVISQAPARFSLSEQYIAASRTTRCSTVANTYQIRMAATLFDGTISPKNNQATKAAANKNRGFGTLIRHRESPVLGVKPRAVCAAPGHSRAWIVPGLERASWLH